MRLPHLTIYTDRFMPEWMGGRCLGLVILIRPKYRDDKALYEHEYAHVKQFYRNPFMGMLYEFSEYARLQYEAEAYAVQVKHGADIKHMSWLLATRYDLDITVEQALHEIKTRS